MFTEYLDCEIRIGAGNGNTYPVSIKAPGGDADGELRLPTDSLDFQESVNNLKELITNEKSLTQLGQALFNALFQGKVKEQFIKSQGSLSPRQGLRIILYIAEKAREVADMPWEFMNDPDQGPLVLLDTSIVRYPQMPIRIPKLQAQLPLKVLLTGAPTPSPFVKPGSEADTTAVNVERELREIRMALSGLADKVQIDVEEHLTASKLQRWLRNGDFHIWHFVGHGAFHEDGLEGRLLFESEHGPYDSVSAARLRILLNRSSVRLIVLDACQSGRLATDPFRSMAPALIAAQIPAVVAMQFTVPQRTTRIFSVEFYQALAQGFPIDACVTEGRKAVMAELGLDRADWGIPIVYTRTDDGKLFEMPPATNDAGPRAPVNAIQTDRAGADSAAKREQAAPVANPPSAPEAVGEQALRNFLGTYFNLEELSDLCFVLGIDDEEIGGETKATKVTNLIRYCQRHGRTAELIAACRRLRPRVSWSGASQSEQAPPAASSAEAEERAENLRKLRELRRTHNEHRHVLENKLATFGSAHAPVYIQLELNDVRKTIADLDRQISELGGT